MRDLHFLSSDMNNHEQQNLNAPNGYWGRVGIVALGTIVSHALLFISFPIIAFLYTPSQFGAFTVYGAFLGFAGTVATLRYEMAIPIASTNREARSLVTLSLTWTVVFCMALATTFWLFGGSLLKAFGSHNLKNIFGFLVIGSMLEGFVRPLRAWNLRQDNMSALACAKVSQSLGLVVCQLLLSFLGQMGLFLGDLAGRGLSATVHLAAAFRRGQLPMANRKEAAIQEVAVRYRRFPLYSTWATVFAQMVDCGPPILLATIYSSSTAGTFAMAHRALIGPMLVISMAITQVYIADCSNVIRKHSGELPKLFWRTSARMALIGIVPITLLAGLGPSLVRLVFKEQWHDSGAFMALLAPAAFGQFVVGPVYQTLDLLQKQKLALAVNGLGLSVVVMLFYCAATFHWPPSLAIGCYGVVVLLYNACLFICAAHAVHQYQKQFKVSSKRQSPLTLKTISQAAA